MSSEAWLLECGFSEGAAASTAKSLATAGYHCKGDFLFFDFRSFGDQRLGNRRRGSLGMALEDIERFHVAVAHLKRDERSKHQQIDPTTGEPIKPTKISECHDL